jgi:hypothetical protein
VIVRLTGGLSNQLFMWAFGRSLSLLHNQPVHYHWCRSTWDFALDAYDIKVDLGLPTNLKRVYNEPGFAFDPMVLEQSVLHPDTYFVGYWQSPKYFVDPAGLRKEIKLKNAPSALTQGVADKLASENSCFIHVRRGDYLRPGTAAVHGNIGMDYYEKAIEYVREKVQNPRFYVFSDDPSYCEQNFSFPVISGSHNTQHEDLYLMRNCKHGIGANSTLSWWANWLSDSQERVSIAPERWFMNPEIDTRDLIPEHWIRL